MSAASPVDTMPTKSSSDAAWIAWYDILPFSKKDNNLLFMRAWQYRGSSDANTQALRAHLKSAGLELAANNVLGQVKDFEYSIIDTAGSLFKVGSTTMILIAVGGVVFTGAIIWRILTPENTGVILGTAAKALV